MSDRVEIPPVPPIPAQWTPDCHGKQDYDGRLVSLSTRYWPAGGGFDTFHPIEGWKCNEDRPWIKPAAKASVYLGSTANEFYDDAVLLAQIEVEADTEAEVKAQVEAWAAEQFARVAQAVLREFAPVPPKRS